MAGLEAEQLDVVLELDSVVSNQHLEAEFGRQLEIEQLLEAVLCADLEVAFERHLECRHLEAVYLADLDADMHLEAAFLASDLYTVVLEAYFDQQLEADFLQLENDFLTFEVEWQLGLVAIAVERAAEEADTNEMS